MEYIYQEPLVNSAYTLLYENINGESIDPLCTLACGHFSAVCPYFACPIFCSPLAI